MRKGIISIAIGLCLALSQAGWARQAGSKSMGMERMEPTANTVTTTSNAYEKKRVASAKHKKYAKKSPKGVKNVHVKGKKRTYIERDVGYQEDGYIGSGGPVSRKTSFGGNRVDTERLPMNDVFPEHR